MLGRPEHSRPAVPLVSVRWEPVAPSKSFFFFKFLIVFVNFWLCWVFIAACPFLWLQCRGFSLQGCLLSGSTGSETVGLSSCGSHD